MVEFCRIRRGRSLDARVMTRILPPILNDFFPPTTILNKVIAEFASNLQPFPDLLAGVLHQVQKKSMPIVVELLAVRQHILDAHLVKPVQ